MQAKMTGAKNKGNMNPFVLFWLGVLTGAMIVGLAFFYGMWQSVEGQTAILRLKSNIQTTPVQVTIPIHEGGKTEGF